MRPSASIASEPGTAEPGAAEPASSPSLSTGLERRNLWLLVLATFAYLPLAFLGYGADVDSYHVLEAADRILDGQPYEHSREPGFLVHEVATALLDALGGSVLVNLGSIAFALVALASLLGLCRRLGVPHATLLGGILAFHPLFWATAATTMDYVWALGFGLAGGVMLLDRRWGWAGVLFALAIGSRITSVLLVGLFVAYVLWQRPDDRRGAFVSAALGFGLGALCFVPTLVQYGGGFGFLVPVGADEQAAWSWASRLGRFGYKNVYVWGLPAALLLAVLATRIVWRRAWMQVRPKAVLAFAAAGVAVYQVLYLRYPLEQEYLLPLLPFVIIGLGLLVERRWLVALLVLVLAYNIVSINLVRPDRPNHATSFETGVWAEPGYLATDIAQRLRVRECRSFECWTERSANGTFPNLFGAP